MRDAKGEPQAYVMSRDAGVLLGALAVLLHVVANASSPYGWQRDEFLYFAMGQHLQLFRMDFPPFIAILARAGRAWFGDSLVATRLFPAFAHAALIVLSARTARVLGGGRFAEWLAALAVLMSPLFMRPGTLFQPVVFDQLWWTCALFALLQVERTQDGHWWMAVGVSLGLGLLTKFSIAFIALPLVIGVVLSPTRRWLSTRWPWIAAGIACLIGLPSVVGQLQLGFPVLTQMHDLENSQLAYVTPLAFLAAQVLFSPVFVPLSLWALFALVRRPASRAVGIACVGAFVLLMALKGKAYYVGPIYPTLFAATAVGVEGIASQRRLVRSLVVAAALVVGVVIAPFGYPVVPPVSMARYAAAVGITSAVKTNQGEQLELPQDYADMLGWEEMVRAVAKVYHALPRAEQEQAVIVGQNYGRAGAVDFFADRYGLPHSVSTAGSYWFFGPGDRPGNVVISIGSDRADLEQYFESVQLVAQTSNPMGVPEERAVPIWVCRSPRNRQTLQSLWPSFAGQN
ncbi:MAG: glycosyltransferase family 39 protein [Gemmatimonadaceae bacterium]